MGYKTIPLLAFKVWLSHKKPVVAVGQYQEVEALVAFSLRERQKEQHRSCGLTAVELHKAPQALLGDLPVPEREFPPYQNVDDPLGK